MKKGKQTEKSEEGEGEKNKREKESYEIPWEVNLVLLFAGFEFLNRDPHIK